MAFSSSRIISILRPPTPPREDQEDVEQGLDDSLQFLGTEVDLEHESLPSQKQKAPIDTPKQTPTSTPEVVDAAISTGKLKKVDFVPFVEFTFHNSPKYLSNNLSATPVRPLQPSKERSSTRSILKPFSQASVNSASTKKYGSFTEMLESIVQQLAGSDTSSRTDAYKSCVAAMETFDSI